MEADEASQVTAYAGDPTTPPILRSAPPVSYFSKAATRPYRVLVAVDLDRTADWALLEGIRLCRGDGELHVVHALKPTRYGHADDRLLDVDQRIARVMRFVEMRLERLWGGLEAQRVEAHLRAGAPAETVLQAAHDVDADIIVVGSHRRTGLRRLLHGSIAARILRKAHCPVVVAFPRTSPGSERSERIAPPCAECIAIQTRANDLTLACDQHSTSRASRVVVHREERGGRHSILLTY